MHKAFLRVLSELRFLSTSSVLKKGKQIIANCFTALSVIGVNKELDETNRKYIIQMNLIGVVTFLINAFTGILFFFIHEPVAALICITAALVWLSPLYINRNGLQILSRVFGVFFTAGTIFVAACWFSHDTLLDNYLLVVAVNCNFMYSHKERKWQLVSIALCLALYIIESTSFQRYLPSYNRIKDVSATNGILLTGLILNIIVDVIIYAYVNRLRESHLLANQQELEAVQKRIQMQNEDVKTFSIAASHNMQTPLYVASFFLNKVKAGLDDDVSVDLKSNIDIIGNGLEQIEQLVSGLFSYNKIINIENDWEQIDIAREIGLVKKNIADRYALADIYIESHEEIIITNRLLFSIIISNLIDNGLKYNVSPAPAVGVAVSISAGKAVILISDNGIGIEPKQIKGLFKPFNRIQNDKVRKSGNGLGLAGARRAAERIGGTLVCFKTSSKGTVFKLELPVS